MDITTLLLIAPSACESATVRHRCRCGASSSCATNAGDARDSQPSRAGVPVTEPPDMEPEPFDSGRSPLASARTVAAPSPESDDEGILHAQDITHSWCSADATRGNRQAHLSFDTSSGCSLKCTV